VEGFVEVVGVDFVFSGGAIEEGGLVGGIGTDDASMLVEGSDPGRTGGASFFFEDGRLPGYFFALPFGTFFEFSGDDMARFGLVVLGE
jgi:hypothetical protein